MNLFYCPDINKNESKVNQYYFLSEEESLHAIKIMRMKKSQAIKVSNGKGDWFECTIEDENPKKTNILVHKKLEIKALTRKGHLVIAPTKNIDRIEWLVEKGSELGIAEISFIICERSERKDVRVDRLEKIALSAMKQSFSPFLTQIHAPTTFKKFVAQKKEQSFIATLEIKDLKHFNTYAPFVGDAQILIGPEGDFTKNEVELALASGILPVNLGERRLRTETAGLYSVMCLCEK